MRFAEEMGKKLCGGEGHAPVCGQTRFGLKVGAGLISETAASVDGSAGPSQLLNNKATGWPPWASTTVSGLSSTNTGDSVAGNCQGPPITRVRGALGMSQHVVCDPTHTSCKGGNYDCSPLGQETSQW